MASQEGSPPDTKYLLPQDPLFTRLLTLAFRPNSRPAIIDLNTNKSATIAELLSDAIHLRAAIRSTLSPKTLNDLKTGSEEVYIHLLAPGGYEFTVGILAILALGAACSPLSIAQPVNELVYYAQKARAVAIVTGSVAAQTGRALAGHIASSGSGSKEFVSVNIPSALPEARQFIAPGEIAISTAGYQDPNGPGIVIFTSGTTGPPKAAVLRRASITDGALCFAEQLGLTADDTLLHLLPVHHATGIWVSYFPFLQTGATIEFRPGSFDPAWTWERWRKGGLTHFTGVPTIYMRMMRYYDEVIAKFPAPRRREYEKGAQGFNVMMCGTSALPKPINDFWTTLRCGKRIVQRYGSTELGVMFNMPFANNDDVPDGSVGGASIGVDVKLSVEPGKEGEILGKSFNMFSKYLHDPEATKAAFDKDGYFHSGDVARREGHHYFIVGRASVDIIKSGGYKISALDIEREILALPYVGECMVVGVQDEEFGQRVACVLSLRVDETARKSLKQRGLSSDTFSLHHLRSDLRGRLAGYKLPTLLRVIEGELPKSGTSKVVKKVLGPKYFSPNYARDPSVQIWKPNDQALKPKL